MTSARIKADIRRRERARRHEAENALEARTHHTYNRYGEPRHMVGWSRDAIEAWEAKERAAKTAIRARRDAMSARLDNMIEEQHAIADARLDAQIASASGKKRAGWCAAIMRWVKGGR